MGLATSIGNKAGKAVKLVVTESFNAIPTLVSGKTFSHTAVEVTGILDPLEASKAGFKIIAKRCLPPQFKYLGECISLGAHIYAFIMTGGSWNGMAIFLWPSKQVLEKEG